MKACKIAGLALACAVALGVAQPASAGLKIDLVYIDKPPPFYVAGGGELREIMQVAAENWERALKTGNGNWKLKIEFGWDALRDPTFFAQEHLVGEGGNPSRMTHSCIIFNTALGFTKDIAGFFADPTPRDNSEFLDYTSYSISTDAPIAPTTTARRAIARSAFIVPGRSRPCPRI